MRSILETCAIVALAAAAMTQPGGAALAAAGRGQTAAAPSLLGSAESLAEENRRADALKLERYRDRSRLEQAVAAGELVPVGDTDSYLIDEELGEEDPDQAELYVHARPWVKKFLDQFLGQAHAELNFRFAVTSLARPKTYQARLRESNSAAARESTHPTGSTVDISMDGLSWKQKQWVRKRLLDLEGRGLVLATEEPRIGCFHIFVDPSFDTLEPVCSPDDPQSQ